MKEDAADSGEKYYLCYCEECAPKLEALAAKIKYGKDIDQEKLVQLPFLGRFAEVRNVKQVYITKEDLDGQAN